MMNRSYLIGIVVTAVLVVSVWWMTAGNHTATATYPPSPKPSTPSTNSSSSNTVAQPSVSPSQSPSTPPKPSDAAVQSRLNVFQEEWAKANSRSLDFYGKVVDQDGQSVVGAKVTGNVMTTLGFQGTQETPHVTQTDGDGNFEFLGLHGERLGIVPEKDGYLFQQRGNGNWTEDYKANSDNRVILTMWKVKGTEQMIHTVIRGGLACNGTSRSFNLLTGQRDNGSFAVTLTRNPVNIDPRTPFDWTLSLSMSGGGLIEMKDLYPNEAPANGYQTVTVDMPANAPNWSPAFVQSYYFYDGQHYGRVTIRIKTNYQPPPTYADFDAYVNPSGSRNLEFDSSKQINK